MTDASAARNASTQLNLAYSYIQALDTYQSAVREGELANLGALGARLEVIGANIIRYLPREAGGQGLIMPPEVAREVATEAQRLVGLMQETDYIRNRPRSLDTYTQAPSSRARQSADELQEVLMERLENASAGPGFFERLAGIAAPAAAIYGATMPGASKLLFQQPPR
jgi:hypothetical protein